ncbi:MAG: NTP transferase domain-containing protein, partial [Tissierellia bacterium]|nr:NTP transferase domain-containing protein [Tissierellia bacterium]
MNISIILAAGEGTRMKSDTPKVLHRVCGKPILSYIVDASREANIDKNYVIVGHGSDEVRSELSEDDIDFRVQPIGEDVPYGTGYAVMQARDDIEDDCNVVILCGDTPLITGHTIEGLLHHHEENGYEATV